MSAPDDLQPGQRVIWLARLRGGPTMRFPATVLATTAKRATIRLDTGREVAVHKSRLHLPEPTPAETT